MPSFCTLAPLHSSSLLLCSPHCTFLFFLSAPFFVDQRLRRGEKKRGEEGKTELNWTELSTSVNDKDLFPATDNDKQLLQGHFETESDDEAYVGSMLTPSMKEML